METNRKRKLVWGGAAVLSAAGALAAFAARPGGGPAAATAATAEVDRGDVVSRVTASGTVSAVRTVLVSSQVSGRVKELAVDFNAPVRRGQVLARIDPQPFEARVAQSAANAAAARAQVEKARAQLAALERRTARTRELAAKKLVAQEELDSAESDVEVARAEVRAAQAAVAQADAALDQARFELSQTAITAPVDGVVVSRDVDEGQTVAASLQAPTLFTIAEDLRAMQVRAHVSENDVGKLAEGAPATFTVDAFPKEPFTGTIRQVRIAAQTVENVVTYDVIVDAPNPSLRLKPGMTANVTFAVAERKGVLRVPNAALRVQGGAQPAGTPRDRRVLQVVGPGGVRPVPVRIGLTDGTYTEIAEGDVSEGARVATLASEAAGAARGGSRAGGPPGPPRLF